MSQNTTRLLLAATIVWAALPDYANAAESSTLHRMNVGDLTLYYTDRGPARLLHKEQPITKGLYFYTAHRRETANGAVKHVEGFNWRRTEVTFDKQAITQDGQPAGYRLIWQTTKNIQDSDRPAGTARMTATITPTAFSIEYDADIAPHKGFGEIGFYVPESSITDGARVPYEAHLRDGRKQDGHIPATDADGDILHNFDSLVFRRPTETYAFEFSGYMFAGSHGLHFQDFRRSDSPANRGTYRCVMNFDTAKGNEFGYTLTFRLLPPDQPYVSQGDTRITAGDLTAIADSSGRFRLLDAGEVVIQGEAGNLCPTTGFQREVGRQGDRRRIRLRWDTDRAAISKQLIVSDHDAWLLWSIAPKSALSGTLDLRCPKYLFVPPYLFYHPVNPPSVRQIDELPDSRRLYRPYSIIFGPENSARELQTGISEGRGWKFQRIGEQNAYRFFANPSLEEGQELNAAFHYVARRKEAYPTMGFDAERHERGILTGLLPSVVQDAFTIVPARSSKYTVGDRPLPVTVKYYAIDDRSRTIPITWRLIDMTGKLVEEGELFLDNHANDFATEKLSITPPANGVYRAEFTYPAADATRERELVFAVLPELSDDVEPSQSVFGGHIGGGEYLATLAERSGIKWQRTWNSPGSIRADRFMPQRGEYRWEPLANEAQRTTKHNIAILSPFSQGRCEWMADIWQERPFAEYLKVWIEEYVRPVVDRYKDRVPYWEVENEPYYRYRQSPEKYVKLLRATYEAIKAIDPEAKVVGTCGPPGSMGYSWYRETFSRGALQYQDIVSAHLYFWGPWVGAGTAMTVQTWISDIREIMRQNGRELPLWNTETTVSPPASLYTHPSHTRFVRYHTGEGPTDPVEQAQMYFRMLIVHIAENVKYFFHLWHGGEEYTSHMAEYDHTPLSLVVAQAALAKHLHGAEFVERIDWADDLVAFLFRNGETLTVVPWGPEFLKRDRADVTIPLPASSFAARDIFDNPLSLTGDEANTSLRVTWKAFLLTTDRVSLPALRNALNDAQVEVHFAQQERIQPSGTFSGRPADRSDWVGFHPLDLSAAANRGFKDTEPEDRAGGWTDEGPNDMRYLTPGDWLINDVPCRIIDPEDNDGKSCIVLNSRMREYFPKQAVIPVGERLSKLHFLHTVTWGARGAPAFKYVINYADGTTEDVPVTCRNNVANWWYLGDLPRAGVAWQGPNAAHDKVRLWHASHQLQHPEGARAVVQSIDIISESQRPIPVIVAITGVYSN